MRIITLIKKTILILVCVLGTMVPAQAEPNSLQRFFEDTRTEIGSIFTHKGEDRKSLREATSDAWHWLWQ